MALFSAAPERCLTQGLNSTAWGTPPACDADTDMGEPCAEFVSEGGCSMKPVQYRQGDVLLEQIAALPVTACLEQEDGPCILAYGEASGHAHQVKTQGRMWVDQNLPDRRYLEVTAATQLEHEEHSAIPLEPAVYKIMLQREYDPGHPHTFRRVLD
jgi:hypothetical protein